MFRTRRNRIRAAIILTATLIIGLFGPSFTSSRIQTEAVSTAVDARTENGVFGYARITGTDDVAYHKKSSRDIAATHRETLAEDTRYIESLGKEMTNQLSSYMNSTGSSGASITGVSSTELAALNRELVQAGLDGDYVDIVSKVTFYLPAGTLPTSAQTSDKVLFYVEQAISRYPVLCCLFTIVMYDETSRALTVYSPIAADAIKNTTNQYRQILDEILRVPQRNNSTMSTSDKLLWLHDEIVAMTEYSTGRTGVYAVDYTPVGAMINNWAVCQSYAAVFNQAALELGIECYVVDSDTHAWNIARVDGSWYYIDCTWDDTRTAGQGKDQVRHDYFLVNRSEASSSSFSNGHTLNTEYRSHFSELTGALGTDFGSSTFFPKKEKITTQMGYTNGSFYYSKDNTVYQWIRSTNQKGTITGLPAGTSRRVSVLDDTLYISGSDGMYQMNPTSTSVNRLDSLAYSGMYEAAGHIYVTRGEAYYIYASSRTAPSSSFSPSPTTSSIPGVSPTPTPYGWTPTPIPSYNPGASTSPATTSTPTPTPKGIPTVPPTATATIYDPTLVTPTPTPYGWTPTPYGWTPTPIPTSSSKPTASSAPTATPYSGIHTPGETRITKIKNKKTRSVYLRWKRVKIATRYQVQYSPSSTFNTKQIHSSLTHSVTIVNLFKNKTYYFRVRAVKIKRIDGVLTYRYGKWCKKRKVKIKK